MIFQASKDSIDFPRFKSRLIVGTLILDAFVALVLFLVKPLWVVPFISGSLIGIAWLFSLFSSAQSPLKRFTILFSIVRMTIAGFLIAYSGGFKALETAVVFSGFLSYKLILVLEYVRYSIGIGSGSGK